jgi:hypothetical protein
VELAKSKVKQALDHLSHIGLSLQKYRGGVGFYQDTLQSLARFSTIDSHLNLCVAHYRFTLQVKVPTPKVDLVRWLALSFF